MASQTSKTQSYLDFKRWPAYGNGKSLRVLAHVCTSLQHSEVPSRKSSTFQGRHVTCTRKNCLNSTPGHPRHTQTASSKKTKLRLNHQKPSAVSHSSRDSRHCKTSLGCSLLMDSSTSRGLATQPRRCRGAKPSCSVAPVSLRLFRVSWVLGAHKQHECSLLPAPSLPGHRWFQPPLRPVRLFVGDL